MGQQKELGLYEFPSIPSPSLLQEQEFFAWEIKADAAAAVSLVGKAAGWPGAQACSGGWEERPLAPAPDRQKEKSELKLVSPPSDNVAADIKN